MAIFRFTQFFAKAVFIQTNFNKAEFRSTYFDQDANYLFQEWNIKESVIFSDVVFSGRVQFQRCDMAKVMFRSCDLVKVNFSNCKFKRNNNRLVLLNDSDKDFRDLSNMYRQLKRNRMDSKDWTDAGDAYRSEMVMKRKLLRQEIKEGQRSKIVNWGIMGIHSYLAGYQQSMGRPLAWLFGSLLIWPFIFYISNPEGGFFLAFKMSIDAALPIIGKIELYPEYPSWVYFLLVFERLFSIILITFFVLATRVRLRQ